MSDPTKYTAKSAEKKLSSRFGWYLFAIGVFYGAHFIYRAEGTAFDILAGIMASTLVYTALRIIRQEFATEKSVIGHLRAYKAAEYKFSGLFKSGDLWFWIVPALLVPYLLYTNDFPINLLRFGICFVLAYVGIYLTDLKRSIRFYKSMDQHINWESLEKTNEEIK